MTSPFAIREFQLILYHVPVCDPAIRQTDFVMHELIAILIGFDPYESQREQDGAGMEEFEPAELVHFERSPGHHGRYARGDQHDRIASANGDIEPAVRPKPFGSAPAQQYVGRE